MLNISNIEREIFGISRQIDEFVDCYVGNKPPAKFESRLSELSENLARVSKGLTREQVESYDLEFVDTKLLALRAIVRFFEYTKVGALQSFKGALIMSQSNDLEGRLDNWMQNNFRVIDASDWREKEIDQMNSPLEIYLLAKEQLAFDPPGTVDLWEALLSPAIENDTSESDQLVVAVDTLEVAPSPTQKILTPRELNVFIDKLINKLAHKIDLQGCHEESFDLVNWNVKRLGSDGIIVEHGLLDAKLRVVRALFDVHLGVENSVTPAMIFSSAFEVAQGRGCLEIFQDWITDLDNKFPDLLRNFQE